MSSTVDSYSVGEFDKENQELYKEIKDYSKKTGISMSKIVLFGFSMYKKTIIDPQKQLEVDNG